jgi:hypothetical protein
MKHDNAAAMTVSGGGGAATTLDPSNKFGVTLSGGNLVATSGSVTADNKNAARATVSHSSGKYYVEAVCHPNQVITTFNSIGIVNSTFAFGTDSFMAGAHAINWRDNGDIQATDNGVYAAFSSSWFADPSTLGFAIDIDNKLVWGTLDGITWTNSGVPAAGTGGTSITITGTDFWFCVGLAEKSCAFTANFGGSAYTFTKPTGFSNW